MNIDMQEAAHGRRKSCSAGVKRVSDKYFFLIKATAILRQLVLVKQFIQLTA